MGGKRWKTGKHLSFCLAGLLLTGFGCVTDRVRPEQAEAYRIDTAQFREGWQHLEPVQLLVRQRDFDGAMKAYEHLLLQPAASEKGDLVLFDLGLLHAHYANPRKDYQRSLAFFSRLVKEYPRSPLAEEARIWSGLLETMERSKRVDMELDEKKRPGRQEDDDGAAETAGRRR